MKVKVVRLGKNKIGKKDGFIFSVWKWNKFKCFWVKIFLYVKNIMLVYMFGCWCVERIGD